MEPQRWALIESLYHAALEREPEDRPSFLQSACGGDAELRREIESLLGFADADLTLPARGSELIKLWEEIDSGGAAAQRSVSKQPLKIGQVLENRFRILRELGHGGMGVVYEAFDARLERLIAIKCAKAGFGRWLSTEARHASEISHPNVCKTYEIHTADIDGLEVDYITMELIDGQTLADRLRQGNVPKAEARSIATQVCAGLAEAHRRHVIHGDLKAGNILLAAGTDGVRAVITDFGLARHWMVQPAIRSGEVGGSLDYMAPELFHGARPSGATDIYALGVILHELANGRKPSEVATISNKDLLPRSPAPARIGWRRIIRRCLEADPARRYGSVAEISRALSPTRRIHWGVIAAAAVLFAGLAGVIAYRTAISAQETIRLAVLPFEADTESRVQATSLVESLSDSLKNLSRPTQPVPGLSDAQRKTKLRIISISDVATNHAADALRSARISGATHTLWGVLRRNNDRLSIYIRVSDARSGNSIKEWQEEYAMNELYLMPVALAGVVTGTLHLPPLASVASVNRAASGDFAVGVRLSRRNTGVEASIPFLNRAASADPDSALIRARLAESQFMNYRLTGNASWLEESKLSLSNAEKRNPDLATVRLVSAMLNESEGFFDKAESDLRRALDLEPLNGEVWRRLGRVYQENNKLTQALPAFQKAIEVQPYYFKNFQDLCSFYVEQANYQEAVRQCKKVVELAPDLSDAHFALGTSYCHNQQYSECEGELRTALTLDPNSSRAMQSLAVMLFYQTRMAEAIPVFERAIKAGPPTVVLYLDLGTALHLNGRVSEERKVFEKGVAMAERELANNPDDGLLRSELALLCARLGQRARAESEALQCRRYAEGSVEVAILLVRAYEILGERERAIALIQNFPVDALQRISNSPDLVDLSRDVRFRKLKLIHHI